MAPVISRRSRGLVPSQIPTEVLGQIYQHVDRPAEFGAVNSVFRGVQTDGHFEKLRQQRLIEEVIHKNNGRVFDGLPFPHAPKEFYDLFFNEYGCVIIGDINLPHGPIMDIFHGKNIKQITIKALVGLKSISNAPRFVPVGRFVIFTERYSGAGAFRNMRISIIDLMDSYWAKLEQNNPTLKTDLLRTLSADLQNSCTSTIMNHVDNAKGPTTPEVNYKDLFVGFLSKLPTLEQEDKTVMDLLDAICDPPKVPELRKENVKVVGDTLEVSLLFTLTYMGYWY